MLWSWDPTVLKADFGCGMTLWVHLCTGLGCRGEILFAF